MARPKNRTAPKYRHHKPSGKASVVINGKYHYLGDGVRQDYFKAVDFLRRAADQNYAPA